MDRLASYASQESVTDSPEVRQEKELAAASKLLENVNLSKTTPQSSSEVPSNTTETAPSEESTETSATKPEDTTQKENGIEESTETTVSSEKSILATIKLYEIFYEQVLNLVNVSFTEIGSISRYIDSFLHRLRGYLYKMSLRCSSHLRI